jgi:cell filamentation protein
MKYNNSGKSTYFYKNTDVYINYFDVKDQSILTQIETDITLNRISELSAVPIKGRFSLTHLLKIHKYIFSDIYPFAGKTRNENISKGSTLFCNCEYICENFNQLYSQLKKENFLKDLEINVFSERLAYYMAELNMIHPFREGNGRAIREYIRCLALAGGYIIHWDEVDKKQLLDAMIMSVNKEYSDLKDCLYKAIEK